MKKHIALFALSAATLLGLSACNGVGGDTKSSSGDSFVSSSEVTTSEGSSSETTEVDTSVKLTIDASAGIEVAIKDAPNDGKYYPGDDVSFTVGKNDSYPSNKAITGVEVNGQALTPDSEGVYCFVMGKKGATIKVNEKTLGDIAVDSVSDIDATKIPTLAKEDYGDKDKVTAFVGAIAEIVKTGDSTHEKFLRGGTFSIENSPLNTHELANTVGFSGSINPGKGHLYSTGSKIKAVVSAATGYGNSTYKYIAENGYADEDKTLYYKRNTSWSPNTSSYYDYQAKADSDQIYLYHVVSDEIESDAFDSKTMIKESEAKGHATRFGLGSVFATNAFSDSYSCGLAYASGDDLVRQIKDVKTTLAPDGKSYSLDVTAFDLSNLDGAQFFKYVYSYTVDGDGFVSRLALHKYKYTDKDYWDSEKEKLTDDAVPSSDSYTDFALERGYKYSDDEVGTTNVEDYVMSDYDVEITAQGTWSGGTKTYTSVSSLKDGEVLTYEVGMEITSFAYRDYTSKNAVLVPTFAGTKEDGYLTAKKGYSSTTYTVAKAGETALLFKNWLGEIKEVPVKFINTLPHGISASLSASTVLVGEPITLTASVTPSTAPQEYTVTLADNDPTESTLTKNDDGTYTITPTKIGISSVTIASSSDASISKTLTFAAAGAATLDGVKALLPTVTFVNGSADKSKFGYDTINVNFNSDGTGAAVAYYGGTSYGQSNFTWAIDEASLEITIVQGSAIDDITLSKLTPVNSASFQLTFTKSSTEYTIDIYTAERVSDLAKGPWASAVD